MSLTCLSQRFFLIFYCLLGRKVDRWYRNKRRFFATLFWDNLRGIIMANIILISMTNIVLSTLLKASRGAEVLVCDYKRDLEFIFYSSSCKFDPTPAGGNEILNILIYPLWYRDKARRWVPPLYTQCFQNLAGIVRTKCVLPGYLIGTLVPSAYAIMCSNAAWSWFIYLFVLRTL